MTTSNFPSAIQTAARLEPEKIRYDPTFPSITLILERDGWAKPIESLTQDDIDQLAAVFGWEYWVVPQRGISWEFFCTEDRNSLTMEDIVLNKRNYPSKLEAAKAAFVAIIKQVEKERQ